MLYAVWQTSSKEQIRSQHKCEVLGVNNETSDDKILQLRNPLWCPQWARAGPGTAG